MTIKEKKKAVEKIKQKININPKLGIILGSGLGPFDSEIKNRTTIKYSELPGFPEPGVKGHKGEIVIGEVSGLCVAVFNGRVHYYEGYSMEKVIFPVELLDGLGVKNAIITNAGGGINEKYKIGDIVIVRDHINFMGENPLRGSKNFIDLKNAYNPKFIELCLKAGKIESIDLKQGIYVGVSGPTYETRAEIDMFRKLGADIVGMSTVPEVIAAKRRKIKVLVLSIISNNLNEQYNKQLSHKEVLNQVSKNKQKVQLLLKTVIGLLKDKL
ncbi:MAG: purine-nucleoside phosphorylase [Elusimicrobiota bacterium]